MNKRILSSSLACLVLGIAPAAMADTYITETYSFTPGSTPYNSSVNVAQLNLTYGTAYGDVDAITINASITLTGNATMANNNVSGTRVVTEAGSSASVTMSLLGQGGSSTANGNTGAAVLAFGAPNDKVIPSSSSVSFSPGQSRNYTLNKTQTTMAFYNGSSTADAKGHAITGGGTGLINDFLGSGSTSVDLEGKANVSYSGANGMTYTSTDDLTGVFEITFEVVPEPSSWMSAALLFGVVGVSTGRSLWRKRGEQGRKTENLGLDLSKPKADNIKPDRPDTT